jgi:hypothetical protein
MMGIGSSLAYMASKGRSCATIGMARAFGPGCGVNAIAPACRDAVAAEGPRRERYAAAVQLYKDRSALDAVMNPRMSPRPPGGSRRRGQDDREVLLLDCRACASRAARRAAAWSAANATPSRYAARAGRFAMSLRHVLVCALVAACRPSPPRSRRARSAPPSCAPGPTTATPSSPATRRRPAHGPGVHRGLRLVRRDRAERLSRLGPRRQPRLSLPAARGAGGSLRSGDRLSDRRLRPGAVLGCATTRVGPGTAIASVGRAIDRSWCGRGRSSFIPFRRAPSSSRRAERSSPRRRAPYAVPPPPHPGGPPPPAPERGQ